MAGSFSLVRLIALIILLQVTSYCSALTLPLNVSSILTNTTSTSLSEPQGPAYYDIAEAPGFRIRLHGYDKALRANDCLDVLIIAQCWLLDEARHDPGHPTNLEDMRTFITDSVRLTLRVRNIATYGSAALFVAGMIEWGTKYGFSEVKDIVFVNPGGTPLAQAELEASGGRLAVPKTSSHSLVNATGLSHDPFIYPISTVPGFYIRFMTYNVPLPKYDCLRALELADATLLSAYQQKVRFLNEQRTWSFGKASFTLTPSTELTTIDATLFVLGTMQLGSEKGFVEARAIFLRTEPDLRGELQFYGTGRLTRVGKAIS